MVAMQTAFIANRYQIIDKLGEGGMGAVYRAYDRLTQDDIALKRLTIPITALEFNSLVGSRPDDRHHYLIALINEFRTVASLRHPHIISVRDYGIYEEQPYFTMDLLHDPQTITEAAQGLDTNQRVQLVIELLQALSYLHRRGIIHRDLKPDNVAVVAGGVKVLDFGLAVTHDANRQGRAGTMAYMAPETLGKMIALPQSDLYAVGVMLYEMFAGKKPFESHNIMGILKKAPDLLALSDTPPLLRVVIERLLMKSPDDRYQTAFDVLVALCEAIEVAPPQDSAGIRESVLQAATFIGREKEMQTLTEALNTAQTGQGSSFLIAGESGVGKSRLMDELRIQALVSGVRVLRGGAVESGGLPYQLWRNIARQLVLSADDLSALDASVLKDIVPDIGDLLQRDVANTPELTGEAYRTRLRLTFMDLLRQQRQTILFLLDDLQWAEQSLPWLEAITEIAHEHKWLIVGDYRSDEAPYLPERLPQTQLMVLPRLQDEDIRRLSESVLGQANTRAEVVTLLTNESEGNAFFIVETLRTLAVEAGRIDDIGKVTLPDSVITEGMLNVGRRRLQRLPESDQPLLRLAAVAGRGLDFAILRQMDSEMDYAQWLLHCQEAAILDVNDGEWRFAHDKIRESILADLDAVDVPPLHRQVAEAIERAYPHNADYHEALLNHWHQAGDFDKELPYLEPVAEQMIEIQGAYDRASDLLERSLARMAADDARQVAFLNWLARLNYVRGAYTESAQLAERVHQLAVRVGDQRGVADSLHNMGMNAYVQGAYSQARHYHQQSLAIYQELGHERGIGNSLNSMGNIAVQQADYEQALDFYQQSLSIRRKLGDQYGIAIGLNNMGHIARLRSEYGLAFDLFQQSLDMRQQLGDQRGIADSLHNMGNVALQQVDYKRALAFYQQSLDMRQQLGDQRGIAASLNNMALVAYQQEAYERARDLHHQCLAIRQALGDQHAIADSLNNLGIIAYQQGDYTSAPDLFQQSLDIRQQLGDQHGMATALYNIGKIKMYQGDYETATALYQQSLDIIEQLGDQLSMAIMLYSLGWIAVRQKDAQAPGYFVRSLTIAHDIGTPDWQLFNIVGFADLLLQAAHPVRCAELLGCVQQHSATLGDLRQSLDDLMPQLQAALAPDDLQAALERGQSLDLDTIVQDLLAEFGDDLNNEDNAE